MATATSKKAAPAAKPGEASTLDYLQKALDDLDHARGQAQRDAQGNIESAMDRIRDVKTDLRARAREEAEAWQHRLESASEDLRRELASAAIRAQRSPEALTDLEVEILKRKDALRA